VPKCESFIYGERDSFRILVRNKLNKNGDFVITKKYNLDFKF
jgi:hypothetical protein